MHAGATPPTIIDRQRLSSRNQRRSWTRTDGAGRTENNSLRHNENVRAITGVEVDYDAEEISPRIAAARLRRTGVQAFIYTSPSHSFDRPRFRVLCPTSGELPPDGHPRLVARLNGQLDGVIDKASFALSQSYFFCRTRDGESYGRKLVTV